MRAVHGADAAGGCDDRCSGENCQNQTLHIKDRATEIGVYVKLVSKIGVLKGNQGFSWHELRYL
jgi:hypothetical protein